MTDHAVSVLDAPTVFGRVTAAPAVLPVPTAAGDATVWTFHATDKFGAILFDYPTAQMVSITWTLNAPAQAIFRIPIDAPDLDQLPLTGGNAGVVDPIHEVKIYRNGSLIFWGPCVTRRANSKDRVYEYTAYDPLWYLLHRYIGQAQRFNYLAPAIFASDWTEHGTADSSDDTDRYVLSPSSIQLTGGSGGEDFVAKTFTQTSTSIGLALIVTAWLYIDDFEGIAAGSNGLVILRQGASGPGARANMQITAVTDRGKWVRLSGAVLMPASVTEVIEVRLYAPIGTVHWNAITVTIEESVSLIAENAPDGVAWDQVQIAQQVVRYLSGSWAVGPSYSKSKLEIAVAGDLSGIVKERTYQFFDHQPGYQGGTGSGVLDEWPKAADGFDYRLDLTVSSRTFRTYYPTIGVDRTADIDFVWQYDPTLELPANGTLSVGIVGWEWGETIDGSATDVCILGGWGSGAGREEGGSSFLTMADLTLELVEAAPNEAPIDLLDQIAQGRNNQLDVPILTPVLTMIEPKDLVTQEVLYPLIGVLLPGDFISVLVEDGDVKINNGAGVATPERVAQVLVSGDDVLTVALQVH